MPSIIIDVAPGDVFEFWVRAAVGPGPGLTISAGERLCWKVAAAAAYFVHHRYETYEAGPLTLTWDPGALEVTLGYVYRPAAVYDDGVTFIRFEAGGLSLHRQPEHADWYAREEARPRAHFSPFQGWMNDPNGSCWFGGYHHLFYQFHPNSTVWGPMHWGHAVSRDLVAWRHLPVFRHPRDNLAALGASGGAFSGSALVEEDRVSFYMTQRLPTYANGVREIQERVEPDAAVLRPARVETVLDRQPEGSSWDFRDPKVWRGDDGGYRMIIGSAIDGDPAVLLFKSPDGRDWAFNSVPYRAPEAFRTHGAKAVECPDFFQLGERWVLIVGFIGYTDPQTGRRNLTYGLTGRFEGDVFTPDGEPQELDFGTDFYALQTYRAGERQLAFAWMFNWAEPKPPGSAYSGEMSLPREVRIDGEGSICLPVAAEVAGLRRQALDVSDPARIVVPDPAFVIELGEIGESLAVELTAAGGTLRVVYAGGCLAIEGPRDGGITYRSRPLQLRDLTIHFDRGALEVTANGGAINGTRRSYEAVAVTAVSVSGAGRIAGWTLGSVW